MAKTEWKQVDGEWRQVPKSSSPGEGIGLVVKIAGGIVLAVVVLAVGCSVLVASSTDEIDQAVDDAFAPKNGVVSVSAPRGMCWSGAIDDSTREGCGNGSYDVSDTIIVANAQKQTGGRWSLLLVLEVDGVEVDRSETTAEYGIASVDSG